MAESSTKIVANRRDILRGATGLAAAAVAGSTLLDRNRVAVAAGPNGRITGRIGDLQFEVLAFSWGLSNSGTWHVGGGAGAGKASLQDLALTKSIDAATPQLMVASASGTHYPTAMLTYADSTGKPILRLNLGEVLVSSLALGGSGGGDALTENVTLNFAKIQVIYGDGSNGATGGWDARTNQPA